MLVDTHCHLGDERFDDDRSQIVGRARDAGVGHVVVIADTLATTTRAIELANEHGLSATAGVHPHAATSWTPQVAQAIEQAVGDPIVVAIGEAGLDYYYDNSPREVQR